LRAVHNLLLSCYLQPGRGDASLRLLRWGLDVSGISQSRAEDRCNPPSSPLPPVQIPRNTAKSSPFPGSAGVPPAFFLTFVDPSPRQRLSPPQTRPSSFLSTFDCRLSLPSDAPTWPLRCSLIAVLVSSKRQRSACLTAKRPSALPASASARITRLGIVLELPQ